MNLDAGDSATFSGPSSITNIITRVTGGSSTIDGSLRSTVPNANFFLINSSGIQFGPNAHLDIGGSFNVSTANDLRFADGSAFGSSAADPVSQLTTAAPASFGFLSKPAAISISGTAAKPSVLNVSQTKTLRVVGGLITLQHASLSASSGKIELAAAGASTRVPVTSSPLALNGNIQMSNSTLNTSHNGVSGGSGGGLISLVGGRVSVDSSSILSRTVDGTSRGISVGASQQFSLSTSTLDVSSSGFGHGGGVRIKTPHLTLRDASILSQATGVQLGAANLSVSLDVTFPQDDDLSINVQSPQSSKVALTAAGDGITGVNFNNTIFDDRAANRIDAPDLETLAAAGFPGSYRPEQVFDVNPDNDGVLPATLSTFVNQPAKGVWHLNILNSGTMSGSLNSWSLNIGGKLFQTKVPAAIAGSGEVHSPLRINQNLTVKGDAVPTAGHISISASRADTSGHNVISAASPNGGNVGIISTHVMHATKDGASATLQVDTARQGWFLNQQRISADGSVPVDNGGTIDSAEKKNGGTAFTLTGGEQRGANVFFSLNSFDLGRFDTATFARAEGSATPAKIFIVRVTGGPSNIEGAIDCTVPNARLYLMNPAGLTFAADATLLSANDNLGDTHTFAFTGTTADYIGLSGSRRFNAAASAADASLTAGVPSAFGFNASRPRGIEVLQGVRSVNNFVAAVSVDEPIGESLSFVAGGLFFSGLTQNLAVGGDRLNLVSVGSPGVVNLGADFDSPAPAFSGFAAMGPITVTNAADIGGTGRNTSSTVTFLDASHLDVVRGGAVEAGAIQVGGINVHAGVVHLDQAGSPLASGLLAYSGDNPTAPNVTVHAGQFSIIGGGRISTRSFGSGPAGSVDVKVDGSLLLDGTDNGDNLFTGIVADAGDQGSAAGSIKIRADALTIMRNARIKSTSKGTASGGDISIMTTHDFIDNARPFAGEPGIKDPSVNTSATNSDGGNITISSLRGQIRVEGTSQLYAVPEFRYATIDAKAASNANVTLQAQQGIIVRDAPISAQALSGGGGQIRLNATGSNVILSDAIIDGRSAANQGPVKVIINADNFIESTDSVILSDSITAPLNLDIAGSLIGLPATISRGELKLQDACRQFTLGKSFSSFVIEGANGVPLDPEAWSPALMGSSAFELSTPRVRKERP